MGNTDYKEAHFTISGNVAMIAASASNICYMISEIIDNSLGSLGIDISKKDSSIKNTIEIFFEYGLDKEKLNLTITDDCGGMDPSEKNITEIMEYGNIKKEYKEPYFNIFGQGMKHASIWSAVYFDLKTVYKNNFGAHVYAEWDIHSINSNQSYKYQGDKDIDIFWKSKDQAKIKEGTQVFFGDLYQNNQKYTRSNLEKLNKYLGWRFSKYIEKGLKINMYFYEQNGNLNNTILGAETKETTLLSVTAPKYEKISKYISFLEKKHKSVSIDRNQFIDYLIDEFRQTNLDDASLNELKQLILEDKPLMFSGVFQYIRVNDQVLNFPYEIGFAEYRSYEGAYNYNDIFGLSIYQAHRALEHGPRFKENTTNFISPRVLRCQQALRTAHIQRWIGSLNVDDYIKNEINGNAMTKNKETLLIDDEIIESFLEYINHNYETKYDLVLNKLNSIQRESSISFLKISNKIIREESTNFQKENLNTAKSSSKLNEMENLLTDDHSNFSGDNSILEKIAAEGFEIVFETVIDKKTNFIREAVFEFSNDKNIIKFKINEYYYKKYGIKNDEKVRELVAEISLKLFWEANEINDKVFYEKLKKILE